MNRYLKSMAAGFIATIVLSALMVMKSSMGIMPELNPVGMLSGMAHSMMGISAGLNIGWLAHFMIGTVLWGLLFALLYNRLPGQSATKKGLMFSVLAWLLMMLIPMPMAGAGFFGITLGIMAPVMTLILHLIWGAVLGYTYGRMTTSPLTQGHPAE
ncbi:TPA: hypothetical protein RH039_005123 [Escherichia coli]|jgi:uncharacterized membrane protein YagU involved in acid resistance|uniref:Uncharacterized protein n=9 Tax=Enterobacteriaceae TaxID=543 RepID=A0A0A1E0C3_ECOLX|nr:MULTISPECIES: DUF6789 family protein [Enterobacterales]EAA8228217.1 hypothetical protein [Salmonella enterica subsp. enterica]EBH9178938.1 hypothetical protein [Salmonella enterica subsp. enterica serovar 4,[5],12:i:-]ECB4019458.1 hypothetical protein [Salmonella enterica subsp. enterica serovar Haifa]ECE0747105.1 hypothetical protein [Salmonella enterica subsp. enterica serovar Meleagridis]ECI0704104.1 hypothetical protein [Salmonella enterica subsp. enterica serovar 4,12:i:-]ECM4721319.1